MFNQSKVKSLTGKLPHNSKVAETSNYAILTMMEPEVALKTTLTSRKVNNRALEIQNHDQHKLA